MPTTCRYTSTIDKTQMSIPGIYLSMAHVPFETIWGLSLIKQGLRKFAYVRDFDVDRYGG